MFHKPVIVAGQPSLGYVNRVFQRALQDLLKLRAEKRKAEIGFESQKQAQAQQVCREAEEKRKVERHTVDMEIRKTRLEREKSNATIRAIAAATKTASHPKRTKWPPESPRPISSS